MMGKGEEEDKESRVWGVLDLWKPKKIKLGTDSIVICVFKVQRGGEETQGYLVPIRSAVNGIGLRRVKLRRGRRPAASVAPA